MSIPLTITDYGPTLTAQINAAASANSTGKVVTLPPGESYLLSPVTLTGSQYAGITLKGHPSGSVLSGGIVVPPIAIQALSRNDPLYNAFPSQSRSQIKVVDLGTNGINVNAGQWYPGCYDPQYTLPNSANIPIQPSWNGVPLQMCGEYEGLINWRTVTSLNPATILYSGSTSVGTTNSIQDNSKSWTPNALVGQSCLITSGTYANLYVLIVSNTSNTIVFDRTFSTSIAVSTSYQVIVYEYIAGINCTNGGFTNPDSGTITDCRITYGLWDWAYKYTGVRSCVNGAIVFASPMIYGADIKLPIVGQRFKIENSPTYLVSDNTYYLSLTQNKLYFIANSPGVLGLATTTGYGVQMRNGSGISFTNIGFRDFKTGCLYFDPSIGSTAGTSTITGCTFVGCGKYAIWAEGLNSLTIDQSHFKHLHGAAIRASDSRGPVYYTKYPGVTQSAKDGNPNSIINITNSHFDHVGWMYYEVQVMHIVSVKNPNVQYCTFRNSASVAIQFYSVNGAYNNNIFDSCCQAMGDLGVVYTGRSCILAGNTINNNGFRHTRGVAAPTPRCAVYIDDGQCGITISNNYVKDADLFSRTNCGRNTLWHNNTLDNVSDVFEPYTQPGDPHGYYQSGTYCEFYIDQLDALASIPGGSGLIGWNCANAAMATDLQTLYTARQSNPGASSVNKRAALLAAGWIDSVSDQYSSTGYLINNDIIEHQASNYINGTVKPTRSPVTIHPYTLTDIVASAPTEPDWSSIPENVTTPFWIPRTFIQGVSTMTGIQSLQM